MGGSASRRAAPLSLRRGVRPPVSLRVAPSLLVSLAMLAAGLSVGSHPAEAADSLTLVVGGQDEMKTRNLIQPLANDLWTAAVLERVYDRPIKQLPTGELAAYVAKGTDVDADGSFERWEYNEWRKAAGTDLLDVVVYYDFNGVRWHDGTQVTVWDLLFSYHMTAMQPAWNAGIRVLLPGGVSFSYELWGRQLAVAAVDLDPSRAGLQKDWEGEGSMTGDPNLRVALRFRASEPFARFYEQTLAPLLLPLHVWSVTGGGRHADFGCAIWLPPAEASAKDVAPCGTPAAASWGRGVASTESVPGSSPFRYAYADRWMPTDADVIGSGPFRFRSWIPGVEASVDRYDGYYVGGPYDPNLASYLHLPRITAIRYVVYRTTQLGVFALQSGEIDYYHWNVPPEFVPDLYSHPDIAVESSPDLGYFYLGYNLRREPWGYNGSDLRDIGLVLRRAIAHLIDKASIVQNLLQNFGVVADGYVSPANAFWYTPDIPRPGYNLTRAADLLDSPEARAAGIGPDPPGPCYKDVPSGCRSLARVGSAPFEILTPHADYDRTRAAAGVMWADAMRQVGLNAVSKPTAYGLVVLAIMSHQFDLYLLGWRISEPDPDYLFSFFHSSNGPAGQNYNGVANATLDECLEDQRREMDRNLRRQIVFRCQQILGDLRPAEPIHWRSNIQGYRQDRFVNWTMTGGTLFNEWSLFGIRTPPAQRLRIGIDVEAAVPAGETLPIAITVRDDGGRAVRDAEVSLNVSTGTGEDPGTLIGGAQNGTEVAFATDAFGRAVVQYQAPVLFDAVRPVFLRAAASHPDYAGPAHQETIVTVVGGEQPFLRARLDLPAGDVTYPETPVPARLVVRDRWGSVGDAAVDIRAIPDGTTPPPAPSLNLTAFTVTFPRPGIHSIGFNVTKQGHRSAWGFVTVWVIPAPTPPPVIPPDETPDGDAPMFASLGFLAGIAVASAVFWRWTAKRLRGGR